MKFSFVILFAIGLKTGLQAASPPPQAWDHSYSDGGNYYVRSFSTSSGDHVALLAGASYCKVLKHTSNGALLWQWEGPTGDSGWLQLVRAVVDPSGNTYLLGQGSEGQGNATRGITTLRKLTAAGSLAWSIKYEGGSRTNLALDNAGGVYICGGAPFVTKYDETGTFKWSRFYKGPDNLGAEGTALAAMPDGGVVVTGRTTTSSGDAVLTLRYSPTGSAQWGQTWSSGLNSVSPSHIVVDSSGNISVAGGLTVLRYTAEGFLSWALPSIQVVPNFSYPLAEAPKIEAFALDGSGRLGLGISVHYYVYRDRGLRDDYVLGRVIGVSPDGLIEWRAALTEDNKYTHFPSLLGLPGGGFMAGYTDGYSGFGGSFAALLPNGAIDWGIHLGNNQGPLLSRDDLGNIYVVNNPVVNGSTTLRIAKWGQPTMGNPPAVTTDSAAEVSASGARITGAINPKGYVTSWWFEYGATDAYGSRTPPSPLEPGNDAIMVTAVLSGIAGGATVHYRLAAISTGGPAWGPDQSFTTLIPPIPPFGAWRLQKFGSLGTPGSQAGDDPDHDGFPNLVEYAFGGEPLLPDVPSGLPKPQWTEDPLSGIPHVTIEYAVNPTATDLQYRPEAGNNPAAFSGNNVTVENISNNRRRATAGDFMKFMRIRLTLVP